MTVALTTGNNIYYANTMQSIYLHDDLFEDGITLKIRNLESDMAFKN